MLSYPIIYPRVKWGMERGCEGKGEVGGAGVVYASDWKVYRVS